MKPFLVFSDIEGNIYSHPSLRMLATSWSDAYIPNESELVLKDSSMTMFLMPGRHPVGYNIDTGQCEIVEEFEGKEVFALAAFLPPSYLRLASPAYFINEEQTLPYSAYTACGFHQDNFYVMGTKVDKRRRQLPHFYTDCEKLENNINRRLKENPDNRMYKHFSKCALEYDCLAAKNLFFERWEAPLVVSNACNARCVGCLSWQDEDACDSPHERIKFVPTPEELAKVALDHIAVAKEPILSFGQGCEGEPLLQSEIIIKTLKLIRAQTQDGTLHLNTNGSKPEVISQLASAGLNSIRISMNSVVKDSYDKYFNPQGYSYQDVLQTIKNAKESGLFVLINLFVFPGFTDRVSEIEALYDFIDQTGIDMILLRNLNIDPELYMDVMGREPEERIGLLNMINQLKEEFPALKLGYFNLSRDFFQNT